MRISRNLTLPDKAAEARSKVRTSMTLRLEATDLGVLRGVICGITSEVQHVLHKGVG